MGFIGGRLGTYLMKRITGVEGTGPLKVAYAYQGTSKLDLLFGPSFSEQIKGAVVIDFGCSIGRHAVEMAERGARHVIGVDIRDDFLERARQRAASAGVADRCTFSRTPDRPADIVVSLDSFEHFDDPAGILDLMAEYLRPGGRVFASFGPLWYHPYGGHMFSIFPWAHLVFTERAMLEWRRCFRPGQTARTIAECGLNKMTVRRFSQIVAASPFEVVSFDARPIRSLRWLSNRWTREFCTSVVQCTLAKKAPAPSVTGEGLVRAS